MKGDEIRAVLGGDSRADARRPVSHQSRFALPCEPVQKFLEGSRR
jgi:hypothetical protein